MERNGLESRTRDQKVGLWIGGISFFFLASFFLAPLFVESGTIVELSGRANMFDYHKENDQNFTWTELNPYSAAIYAFGDLNCHNKHERSWSINGNQMPVDTYQITASAIKDGRMQIAPVSILETVSSVSWNPAGQQLDLQLLGGDTVSLAEIQTIAE